MRIIRVLKKLRNDYGIEAIFTDTISLEKEPLKTLKINSIFPFSKTCYFVLFTMNPCQ